MRFGKGFYTALATKNLAEAYLASGWCGRCGYKRSAQGNCPNCDHWYTHPFLVVGAPLAASVLILMLVGIRSVRDADPGFARWESGAFRTITTPTYPAPMAPAQRTAPASYFAATTPYAGAIPVKIPAAQKQFEGLESLRETVHTTQRAYDGASRGAIVSPRLTMDAVATREQNLSADTVF